MGDLRPERLPEEAQTVRPGQHEGVTMPQAKKDFGGKKYTLFHTGIREKAEAQRIIKGLRKTGHLARIVKRLTAPEGRPGWNTHYDIYARKR